MAALLLAAGSEFPRFDESMKRIFTKSSWGGPSAGPPLLVVYLLIWREQLRQRCS